MVGLKVVSDLWMKKVVKKNIVDEICSVYFELVYFGVVRIILILVGRNLYCLVLIIDLKCDNYVIINFR